MMNKLASLADKFTDILELARFAPSAHNAQPWQASIDGNEISILNANELVDGDPTGRETYIGIGIFSEAIILTAESMGFTFNNVSVSKQGARITFGEISTINEEAKKLIPSLLTRCTDRSIYKPVAISQKILDEIKQSSHFKGVEIFVSSEDKLIKTVSGLTTKAIGLALSSPSFRNELSHYLVVPWSTKKRGIAVRSLRIPLWLALLQPQLIKHGLGIKKELTAESKRWSSASALILIATDGDLLDDWFNAGRAYLHASLIAESHGLSQATSAAVIEASTYHEDVEALLDTNKRLQCLSRIGKGSSKKVFSPRMSVNDIIATSN